MRTGKFLKNSLAAVFMQITELVLAFCARTVFIYTLGMEYLGISGLFSNVLSLLALTELGIGAVMQYRLYGPTARKEEEKTAALMQLYKRAYCAVALVIALLGVALIPFLPYLIEGDYPEENLVLYYLLYLASTVFSYLLGYIQALLSADQKNYVGSVYRIIFGIGRRILQILLLLKGCGFLVYLILDIVFPILQNAAVMGKVFRMYPFLRKKKKLVLQKEEKRSISQDVRAMVCHTLGSRVLSSTDNILLSAGSGLLFVAKYVNHTMIFNMISEFMNYIFIALMSGVGNMVATEGKEKGYQTFKWLYFGVFWLYSFFVVCFVVLLRPFMILWVGEENAFGQLVVILLAVQFFVTGIRKVPLMFRDVMGLMRYDRYKPLLEAAIKLSLSLLLVRYIDVSGVVMGTIAAMVLTSLWIEPWVVFKHGFGVPFRKFLKQFVSLLTPFLIITAVCAAAVSPLKVSGWLTLFGKGIITAVLFLILSVLVFFRKKEFGELLGALERAVVSALSK